MQSSELCVPIYLNQRIVFDHLAIIEDGFSQLTTVTSSSSASDAAQAGGETSVGVSNIFGFLGVKLGGHYSREGASAEAQEQETQKTHTPASLFAKLRSYAASSELLKRIESEEDLGSLESGDMVEFRAILRKSPLIDALESMLSLMDMALALGVEEQKKPRSTPITEEQKIIEMMRGLLERLQAGDHVELIADVLGADPVKAVLSAKMDYFIGRDASEIIDGEFRVFGKVVRSLPSADRPAINLLRKTPLGAVGEQITSKLVESFDEIEEAEIKLPKVVTTIEAPACQVLPIAIFA